MIQGSIERAVPEPQNSSETWRAVIQTAGQVVMNNAEDLVIAIGVRPCTVEGGLDENVAARCYGGPFARFSWETPKRVKMPFAMFLHDFPMGKCPHYSGTEETLLSDEYEHLKSKRTTSAWRKSGIGSFLLLAGSMRFVYSVRAAGGEAIDKAYTLRPDYDSGLLNAAHAVMSRVVVPYL